MGVKLFSQSRFKQLAQQLGKLLVLVLALNIGLENIYSNYLLADATNTTRLAVLNTIKNNLITNPVFKPAFVNALNVLTGDLNTALAANTIGDPNLFKPGDLNGNNTVCASGASNCQCLVSGLCVVKLTPLALANYTTLNISAQPSPYPTKENYENLILSLLYAGANVAYAINQAPPDGKGYVLPFEAPANTATLANLLANFMVPDSTTYPGLALDKDSGILIKTPAATPAGTVSPFCQALITANPLNQVAPTANNIWLGAICANNTHCCGTNICNLTSGADLGKDSAGNSYGFCDSGCSKFNQSCTSDSNCCGAAESDSPVVCDLTVKKCVSCVVVGDGCFTDTDCCAAQNLKCDQSSMTCVSCVPAGDKAVQATDCCLETNFNSSTKTCDSTCGLVTSSCKTNSDCCTSQDLTCDRITKTCLWDVGRTCDPKDSFKNHYCRDGLSCDSTTLQCEINLGKICAVTPNNCLTGLVCDPVSAQCCKPLNSDCASDQDCFYGYVCDNPQKAANGICKLSAEASCVAPFKATDCAVGLACGFASGSTDNKYTCCAPAGSDYTCLIDSDCCAGSLCDGTSGVYKCVGCIPKGNNCIGIENRCCPDSYCDAGSGQCVPLAACPLEGQQCVRYSDCGGSSCHLVCDIAEGQCQLYGNLGTGCTSDDNCKVKNYGTNTLEDAGFKCRMNVRDRTINGVLQKDHAALSCCAPLGVSCEQDLDCCDDTGGTVTCINKQCQLDCIAESQMCGVDFPKDNGPSTSGVSCCNTNSSGQTLSCKFENEIYECRITLKSPGEACSKNEECDGYDANLNDNLAECNSTKCCSLNSGYCDKEEDCCDQASECKGNECSIPPDGKDWEAWLIDVSAALIVTGAVLEAVSRVGTYFKRIKGIENLCTILKFTEAQKASILAKIKLKNADMFDKGGSSEARNEFAKELASALAGGLYGDQWQKLAEDNGLKLEEIKSSLLQVLVGMIEEAAGDRHSDNTATLRAATLALNRENQGVFRKLGWTGRMFKLVGSFFMFGRHGMIENVAHMGVGKVIHDLLATKLADENGGTVLQLKIIDKLLDFMIDASVLDAEKTRLKSIKFSIAEKIHKLASTSVQPAIQSLGTAALETLNSSLKEKISTATAGVTLAGKNADLALIEIGKASDGKLSMLMLLRASQKELTDYKGALNDLITELNNFRSTNKITATFTDAVDKATFLNIVVEGLGNFSGVAGPSEFFMKNKVGPLMQATCQAIASQKGGGITDVQVYVKLYSVTATSDCSELKQLMPDWQFGAVESARMDLPHSL